MTAIVKSKPISWKYVTPTVDKDHYVLHHGFHAPSKVVGFYVSDERRREVALAVLGLTLDPQMHDIEYEERRYSSWCRIP